MSDIVINRLKTEIQNANNPKGMSTHSGKMQVQASDIERLILKLEMLEREANENAAAKEALDWLVEYYGNWFVTIVFTQDDCPAIIKQRIEALRKKT